MYFHPVKVIDLLKLFTGMTTKISVRSLWESAATNPLQERNDGQTHDKITTSCHQALEFIIENTKAYIGLHVQLYNGIKENQQGDYFDRINNEIEHLIANKINPYDNAPPHGVAYQVDTPMIKRVIICAAPAKAKGMSYRGQYFQGEVTLYLTNVNKTLKTLTNWVAYDGISKRIKALLASVHGKKGAGAIKLAPDVNMDKFREDISAALNEFNKNIVNKAQDLESLMSHELAHAHDDSLWAKTDTNSSVLGTDVKNRDKLAGKTTITHDDYNNLNTEVNAIFFEYMPRLIRDYLTTGKNMANFIPHAKAVFSYYENLNPANLKRLVKRVYTFLSSASDEQLNQAVERLKNYKAQRVKPEDALAV